VHKHCSPPDSELLEKQTHVRQNMHTEAEKLAVYLSISMLIKHLVKLNFCVAEVDH